MGLNETGEMVKLENVRLESSEPSGEMLKTPGQIRRNRPGTMAKVK